MVETFAVAISPDKTHLVVCRSEKHYATISRKEGITKDTKWKDKNELSRMLIKGEYKKLKKPAKYLGNSKKE